MSSCVCYEVGHPQAAYPKSAGVQKLVLFRHLSLDQVTQTRTKLKLEVQEVSVK